MGANGGEQRFHRRHRPTAHFAVNKRWHQGDERRRAALLQFGHIVWHRMVNHDGFMG